VSIFLSFNLVLALAVLYGQCEKSFGGFNSEVQLL
jgi:hypothetical protein